MKTASLSQSRHAGHQSRVSFKKKVLAHEIQAHLGMTTEGMPHKLRYNNTVSGWLKSLGLLSYPYKNALLYSFQTSYYITPFITPLCHYQFIRSLPNSVRLAQSIANSVLVLKLTLWAK
jgi:hypothetical protein